MLLTLLLTAQSAITDPVEVHACQPTRWFSRLLAATPKSEVKRHRTSGHSNNCMPVPPGSYSASNFAGAAFYAVAQRFFGL